MKRMWPALPVLGIVILGLLRPEPRPHRHPSRLVTGSDAPRETTAAEVREERTASPSLPSSPDPQPVPAAGRDETIDRIHLESDPACAVDFAERLRAEPDAAIRMELIQALGLGVVAGAAGRFPHLERLRAQRERLRTGGDLLLLGLGRLGARHALGPDAEQLGLDQHDLGGARLVGRRGRDVVRGPGSLLDGFGLGILWELHDVRLLADPLAGEALRVLCVLGPGEASSGASAWSGWGTFYFNR